MWCPTVHMQRKISLDYNVLTWPQTTDNESQKASFVMVANAKYNSANSDPLVTGIER